MSGHLGGFAITEIEISKLTRPILSKLSESLIKLPPLSI